MAIVLFWISLLVIIYTYLGYPMILWIVSRFVSRTVSKEEIYPSVSIVIAVYNEEDVIARKIENCLKLDYPKEQLEIIVGSDCSSDRTDEIVREYIGNGVKFLRLNKRSGKVSVLNEIVKRANGEILVFADARQIFENNAIKQLVRNFNDQLVGCVSGELVLLDNDINTVTRGLGVYWHYEKMIRRFESEISSVVGATGAIYAIRKKLYVPPNDDIILDDVFIPVKVIEQGYRTVFESDAIAYDQISKTTQAESKRKIRTLAGNWQLFIKMWRDFRKYDFVFIAQVISHKLLRIIAPIFILVLLISNLFLITRRIYRIVLIIQVVFYLCALFNIIFKSRRMIIFNIAYTFCALNLDAVKGFLAFINNEHKPMWK